MTSEGFIEDEVKTSTTSNKKIEIQGIPASGKLKFYIKQTLKYSVSSNTSGGRTSSGSGTSSSGRSTTSSSGTIYRDTSRTYSGEWESISISGMTLKMDSGEDYNEALTQTALINQANNVQMSISIPTGDIPNIPNAETIYALYFMDKKGQPTRMWHTKGQNDHNTLVNHLVQCALRFKRRPSRRITGELFSGKMIDLNSVMRGLRNCNPGNIRISKTKYLGEVTPSKDRAFKQFSTMAWGYRAMFVLLHSYSRNGYRTLRQMINRYAPPIENHTENYIDCVCKWAGASADVPLKPLDPAEMIPIVSAMSRMENGIPAVDADVQEGWRLFQQHKS